MPDKHEDNLERLIKKTTLRVLQREQEIGRAAQILGITRRTLYNWIRKWRLEKVWKLPGNDGGASAAA